ncbi:MAG: hypothetical protein ACRC9P_03380 [Bacteroides sp.]
MINLNTIQLSINGKHHLKTVQFTSVNKEQMLAINRYLGVQAFQEKYLDDIIDSYKDGDDLIPIFYKNGRASSIELRDWLYLEGGEVYSTSNLSSLADILIEASESEEE